jgi:hypothetical protein
MDSALPMKELNPQRSKNKELGKAEEGAAHDGYHIRHPTS